MRPARGLEHPTLDTVAAAYAAVVAERQLLFERLFDRRGWSLDLAARELTVGGRPLRALPLAYVDDAHGTWQWAWASATNPHGEPLAQLIEIGHRQDLPELTTAVVRLSAVHDGGPGPGHTLAIASCGLLAAHAYFPAPYDGGTVWLLITDERVGRPRPDAGTASRLLTAAMRRYPHANRLTVETYLGVHRLPASDDGARITAELGEMTLVCSFDSSGRLLRLTP